VGNGHGPGGEGGGGGGGGDAGLHAQLHVLTYYIHRNIDLNCTVILFKHTFEK